jgi:hypothetical protein
MRRIFWGFCRNRFLIDPLHNLPSRSDFGFEFAEIFVIEKRVGDSPTPRLGESESRLLNVSKKTRRVRESLTPRLGESESRYVESWSRYLNF